MHPRHLAIRRAVASHLGRRRALIRRFLGASLLLLAAPAGGAKAAIDDVQVQQILSPPMVVLGAPGENADLAQLGTFRLLDQPGSPPQKPLILATHQKAAAKPPAKAGANASGLPWRSGSQCYSEGFENFRGRKVDVDSLYLGRASWSSVLGNLRGRSVALAANRSGQVAIALAMLMPGQRFSDCNAGKLDATFKDIGTSLGSGNLGKAIVRLGWEANGTSYAWSIRSEVEPYKACFRRLAGILRKQAPNIQIEWSMRKDNGASVGAHLLYPGNDVVDIIGTSFYDRYPSTNTQAQWDKAYRETKQGGPKGLGTWLDFAKSKGKKLALAEWAVSDSEPSSSKDNPFFIEKVWQFLKANSGNIAYEAYFNCVNTGANIYMIYPEANNPKAAAKYRQLWRSGT